MDSMSEAGLAVTQSPLVTAPPSPAQRKIRSKRHRSGFGSSFDSGRVAEEMEGSLPTAVIRQMDLFHGRTQQQLERSHGAERTLISDKIQDFMAHQKSSFHTQSRSWQEATQSAFAILDQKRHQDAWTRECVDVLAKTVRNVRDIDPENSHDRPVKVGPQTHRIKTEQDVRINDHWKPMTYSSERARSSQDVSGESAQRNPPWRRDFAASDSQSYNPYTNERDPTIENPHVTAVAANLRKINPPPKFNAENLNRWKRELFFWCDIYQAISEDQVLCAIGSHGDTDLKEILIKFMSKTRYRKAIVLSRTTCVMLKRNMADCKRPIVLND